jgi:hypothetical protein
LFAAGSELRILFFWAVSTTIVVGLSAAFLTREPRHIPPVAGLIVVLASMMNRIAAMMAPTPLFLRFSNQWPKGVFLLALLAATAVSMWANLILTQALQNVGYKLVGAKQRPIFWFRPIRRKRRPRRGARS